MCVCAWPPEEQGAFVTPNWTIPRLTGSLLQWWWLRRNQGSHDRYMVLVASGFVLGEGIMAIVNAVLKLVGVGALSCFGCAGGMC